MTSWVPSSLAAHLPSLPPPFRYIALTYDHRLIDGREAVTFLKRVKELCENPTRFLLEC